MAQNITDEILLQIQTIWCIITQKTVNYIRDLRRLLLWMQEQLLL